VKAVGRGRYWRVAFCFAYLQSQADELAVGGWRLAGGRWTVVFGVITGCSLSLAMAGYGWLLLAI
jgi:hypothetical protein